MAFLFTFDLPTHAAEPAQQLLEQAVKAHGGAEALGKFRAATWRGKGTFRGFGSGVSYTGEWAVQPPDKARIAIESDIDGRKYTRLLVINGDRGWVKLDSVVQELNKDTLLEEKKRLYVNWVATLAPLKDAGFQLALLPEGKKIAGKDAVGLKVSREGQPDVVLYFDKESHLLAQSECRLRDLATGTDVVQEVLYSEYRKMGGIQRASRVVVRWDGRKLAEGTVEDFQPREELPERLFAQP